MFPVKKILCPTDFSESSLEAVRSANELAKKLDASVVLLHVVSPMPIAEGMSGPIGYNAPSVQMTKYIEDLTRSSKDALNEWADAHFDDAVTVHAEVVNGIPFETIVDYAETESVDLITITTHGRTGLKRLFMGSVAEGVIRHARCPVLVIRIKEES